MGGLDLKPVVHVTRVEVLVMIEHVISSILILTVVPKLVPATDMTVPPMLGPKGGDMELIVEVDAALYCTFADDTVMVFLGRMSWTLQGVTPEGLTGRVL